MEISHHILDIEKNTRNMTADLESRMKNLINGYEYLENLSSQIPRGIIGMRDFKTGEDNGIGSFLLNEKDREDLNTATNQLNWLRNDLQSITYERSILEMTMKKTISDIPKVYRKVSSSNAPTTRPILTQTKDKSATNHEDDPLTTFISLPRYSEVKPSLRPSSSHTDTTSVKVPSSTVPKHRGYHDNVRRQPSALTVRSTSGSMFVPHVTVGSVPPVSSVILKASAADAAVASQLKSNNKPKRTQNSKLTKTAILASEKASSLALQVVNSQRAYEDEIRRMQADNQRLAAQVNGAQAKIVSIEKDQRDHSKELERSVEDLVNKKYKAISSKNVISTPPNVKISVEEIVLESRNDDVQYRVVTVGSKSPSKSVGKTHHFHTNTPALEKDSKERKSYKHEPSAMEPTDGVVAPSKHASTLAADVEYSFIVDEGGGRWLATPNRGGKIAEQTNPNIKMESFHSVPANQNCGASEVYPFEPPSMAIRIFDTRPCTTHNNVEESKMSIEAPVESHCSNPQLALSNILMQPETTSHDQVGISRMRFRREGGGGGVPLWMSQVTRVEPEQQADSMVKQDTCQILPDTPDSTDPKRVEVKANSTPTPAPTPTPIVGVDHGHNLQSELVSLLHTMVSTQQQTMQGHNELIMRILQSHNSTLSAPKLIQDERSDSSYSSFITEGEVPVEVKATVEKIISDAGSELEQTAPPSDQYAPAIETLGADNAEDILALQPSDEAVARSRSQRGQDTNSERAVHQTSFGRLLSEGRRVCEGSDVEGSHQNKTTKPFISRMMEMPTKDTNHVYDSAGGQYTNDTGVEVVAKVLVKALEQLVTAPHSLPKEVLHMPPPHPSDSDGSSDSENYLDKRDKLYAAQYSAVVPKRATGGAMAVRRPSMPNIPHSAEDNKEPLVPPYLRTPVFDINDMKPYLWTSSLSENNPTPRVFDDDNFVKYNRSSAKPIRENTYLYRPNDDNMMDRSRLQRRTTSNTDEKSLFLIIERDKSESRKFVKSSKQRPPDDSLDSRDGSENSLEARTQSRRQYGSGREGEVEEGNSKWKRHIDEDGNAYDVIAGGSERWFEGQNNDLQRARRRAPSSVRREGMPVPLVSSLVCNSATADAHTWDIESMLGSDEDLWTVDGAKGGRRSSHFLGEEEKRRSAFAGNIGKVFDSSESLGSDESTDIMRQSSTFGTSLLPTPSESYDDSQLSGGSVKSSSVISSKSLGSSAKSMSEVSQSNGGESRSSSSYSSSVDTSSSLFASSADDSRLQNVSINLSQSDDSEVTNRIENIPKLNRSALRLWKPQR